MYRGKGRFLADDCVNSHQWSLKSFAIPGIWDFKCGYDYHSCRDAFGTGIEASLVTPAVYVGAQVKGGGVLDVADLVRLSREDLVSKALEHLSHQIQ